VANCSETIRHGKILSIFLFAELAFKLLAPQNEYSKEIKEYRAQDKSGKSHGKVFVKGI